MGKNSNIIQDEGGFYFFDAEDDLVGPFYTYRQAEIAYDANLKWVARDNRKELKKMKDDMGM